MDGTARQMNLAARPVGMAKESDFDLAEAPIAAPGEGEVVVKIEYISLDPAMRGWINEGRSYVPPVQIGEVMRAFAAGEVVESASAELAVGDHVTGIIGVREYATVPAGALRKVDTALAPLPVYLGTLGMPGMTAYFGLLDIGDPQPGETVVVSGAAGAVGGLVGQIAKLKGARAVGIAGGEEKCRHLLDEVGFDATIDYKAQDVERALAEHCPDGIDVYFDNVGGEILDAALAHLARMGRIVICGAISQYNNLASAGSVGAGGSFRGPSNYMSLLVNHGTMTGFVVSDYMSRAAEGAREMATWLAEGKITAREEVIDGGVEAFPQALQRLFEGGNTGKLVLRCGSA